VIQAASFSHLPRIIYDRRLRKTLGMSILMKYNATSLRLWLKITYNNKMILNQGGSLSEIGRPADRLHDQQRNHVMLIPPLVGKYLAF
jgi:hypothetical protein